MAQYLLSIYQPDGPPPPPEILDPINPPTSLKSRKSPQARPFLQQMRDCRRRGNMAPGGCG